MKGECFKLDCVCGRVLELPVDKPNEPQVCECPGCKAPLFLDWAAETRESAA